MKTLVIAATLSLWACLGLAQQRAVTLETMPSAGKSVGVVRTASVGRWLVLATNLSPVQTESFKRTPEAGGGSVLIFEGAPGKYIVIFIADNVADGLSTTTLTLGGATPEEPVDPQNPPSQRKVTAVTYVYEKDKGLVPKGVAKALQELNDGGSIVATEFEEDTVDGDGNVPDQYKAALTAAKEAGIPCLVVIYDKGPPKIVPNPQTPESVLEAVK